MNSKREYILANLMDLHFFKSLNAKEIEDFLSNFSWEIASFINGGCIVSKDHEVDYIGIILEGAAGIYSESMHGASTFLGYGNTDYIYGFIARFFNKGFSITALYAVKICRVLKIYIPKGMTKEDFILLTPPKLLANIFEILTIHIQNDFNHIYVISGSSVKVKISRYLLLQLEHNPSDTIRLPMTFTEFASYLGIYRTTLHHALREMEENGLISKNKRQIHILNLKELLKLEREY